MQFPADLHSHTIASGHAFNTIHEMAAGAAKAGLDVLGIVDHGPGMDGAPSEAYFDMTHRVSPLIEGVRVLLGCEANIIDPSGLLDLSDETAHHQSIMFAGLHFQTPYPTGASMAINTQAIVAAVGHKAVHAISHPYQPGLPINPEAVAEAVAHAGKLIEVNLSLFRRELLSGQRWESNPVVINTRRMLNRLNECGSTAGFVVSSDAHHVSELVLDQALVRNVAELLETDFALAANFCLPRLARYVPALAS